MAGLLAVDEAVMVLQGLVQPLRATMAIERVPLLDCLGRILAEPIVSPLDFPHWDNSAMDGYALRYGDVLERGTPCELEIIEEIAAGQVPQRPVGLGQAARIFTGAMLPLGADTILIQEQAQRRGERLRVLQAPAHRGEFVRQQGAFHRAGETLLSAGIELGAADIAVLAAAQQATVPVYRQPRVGILSTGDELVDPDHSLGPGQIVDSNRYALAAIARRSGAVVQLLGRLPDQPEALRTAIGQAIAQADLDWVISSGGVSVGDYDYVDRVLADLGGTLHIRAVAVKPGKPLTVATLPRNDGRRDLLYFGLPGNPVSALVSFWRFVQPALRQWSGVERWQPNFIPARTLQPLRAGGLRETYLWGNLHWDDQGASFAIAGGSHSSGNLINLAQANALAKIPVGTQQIEVNGIVEVLPLS